MPTFSSSQPDILLPRDITTWEFLFEHPTYSPLHRFPPPHQAGFTDAITKERLSWPDVRTAATHLSTALVHHHGLRPADTVALFSPNTIWYPVAMHATLRAGGRVTGASPAYTVDEMTYALRKADVRFLMTHPDSVDVAVEAARAVGLPRRNVFLLEGRRDGFVSVSDLIRLGAAADAQIPYWTIPDGNTNADVCGFLAFSSGTTGLPKAVMIAHQNVIAQCLQVYQITPHDHKRILAVLPSFHITGLVHLLHLPLLLNAEVYFLPTFTMKAMLDTVVEYQIPELLLVPPILIRMVRDPIVDAYDLSFLRRFSSGAAPLSPEILHLLRTKFPHTGFKQGYGMTESCSCITAHPPSHYSYTHAPTVGTICASTTIQLLRPDGSHCGPDEPGELCARGPQITTLGYLHDAAASRHTFDADGFLHTGDQAVFDPQTGLVTIVDRIKELIKVKGVAVAPAELEDLLLGHPRVDDVAVVGILDPYSGEVPKAFVRLREGVVEDEEDGDGDGSLRRVGRELLRFVRERKVREKALREVEFVREIPKSASGKILRRVLRERGRVGSGGERGVVVREERAKI